MCVGFNKNQNHTYNLKSFPNHKTCDILTLGGNYGKNYKAYDSRDYVRQPSSYIYQSRYFDVATIALKQEQLSKAELEAAIQGTKESIYDAADTMFSNVLSQFYPDAPRNSIEEEAIIKLQNQLIEERYNKLTKEEKEAYSKNYSKLKYVLSLDKLLQGQNHGTTDSSAS